jgi:signal transduction histidine kinase
MRSLFAKTWLISVVSILLTTGLLFLVVGYFADSFIYDTQKENFEQNSKEILTALEEDAIERLDKYIAQGYTIQLDDVTMRERPAEDNSGMAEAPDSLSSDTALAIQTNSQLIINPEKNFQKKEDIIRDGETTNVTISYPIALTQSEIFDIVHNIAPYFLFIALIVSSIIAIGYAKYFSNKIKSINQVIDEMALEIYPVTQEHHKGDELQELRNNINIMYCKLRNTMTALKEEVIIVKKLEDSRQLFMSGIVHELKTPIMNMSLSLKGLYQEETVQEKKLSLRNQLSYLTGMNRLVSELLELSRVDDVTVVEEIEITPVLKDVATVYAEMLEDKNQKLQLTLEKGATMAIPINKMQKLFSNLLGNAIKYAPKESVIRITVTKELFEIENQAIPIEDVLSIEEMHKPFVTTDDETDYPSHGLGLYLVQSILQFYSYRYSCIKETNRFIYRIFLKN